MILYKYKVKPEKDIKALTKSENRAFANPVQVNTSGRQTRKDPPPRGCLLFLVRYAASVPALVQRNAPQFFWLRPLHFFAECVILKADAAASN